jgi:hypothetical protein
MPHDPRDQRYPHLPLIGEQANPDRRKKPAPPTPPPNRGGRSQFAGTVRESLADMQNELNTKPTPPAGIQPHLVFRVPLVGKASPIQTVEMMTRLGVTVVSIEPDNAIIAFSDDANLQGFYDAVDTYESGPGINPKTQEAYKSTRFDAFEYIEIEEMKLWGRSDRIGAKLAEAVGANGKRIITNELYFLDVELWHRGTNELAKTAIEELRILIRDSNDGSEKICDSFYGQLLCLARVAVNGGTLSKLLDLDIVAEVELPPVARFDVQQAKNITPRDFPTPPLAPPDGPSVCVVDSGATSNHPLLANNFGHAESILTNSPNAGDENGHGTMVSGLAVFGSIRACYNDRQFSSPITLFSARVLNAQNKFDEETLIIRQMQKAITFFANAPYSCRVFNLSLGASDAWLEHNQRQSLWAESLDVLARENNVLLVVSAGNHDLDLAFNSDEAEEVVTAYPEYLFRPECGLADPATAAIPITVGGIAESDSPSIRLGSAKDDIRFGVAKPFQPSPSTRIGPGINDAIKPEFVSFAGNSTFQGMSNLRQIDDNSGMSVMSLSREPTKQMFAFKTGTSFAAPLVARTASMVWNQLVNDFGTEPQANLVRAVLATSAKVPNPVRKLLEQERGEGGVRKVCGYGLIDDELALQSADRRVTMLHQGSIEIDKIEIFEVPIPEEFRDADGKKRITVALAFNPPVRRRRAEYLGVRMNYSLIRGKSLDEVVEAYRQLTQEENKAVKEGGPKPQGAFQGALKCKLQPGSTVLQSSTLQKSTWAFNKSKAEYGDSYYLVVRAERRWAPETFVTQDYAVAVTLQADEGRLYNLLRNRVRLRQRGRSRA